jgi:hypothetical protein
MAIELVTGRGGVAHVHSHDVRQLHRGIFGQDKYRLIDKKNCAVIVSPGSVQIDDGGIIWNGMHIRHWKGTYTYASPASTQTVGVYLHYTKDSDGIEKIEFKIYVGSSAPATNDNFGDNDLEAYTLFYSFTHHSNGSISNGSYEFPIVQPSYNLESNVNQKTNKIVERKVLYEGNAKKGTTFSLKEALSNFQEIEIWCGRCVCRFLYSQIGQTKDNVSNSYIFKLVGGGYSATDGMLDVSRVLSLRFSGNNVTHYNSIQFAQYVSSGQMYRSYSDTDVVINKIIGIERKL